MSDETKTKLLDLSGNQAVADAIDAHVRAVVEEMRVDPIPAGWVSPKTHRLSLDAEKGLSVQLRALTAERDRLAARVVELEASEAQACKQYEALARQTEALQARSVAELEWASALRGVVQPVEKPAPARLDPSGTATGKTILTAPIVGRTTQSPGPASAHVDLETGVRTDLGARAPIDGSHGSIRHIPREEGTRTNVEGASPEAHPWAAFLQSRMRCLAWLRDEQHESAEQIVRTMQMDSVQVRLLLQTYDDSKESP